MRQLVLFGAIMAVFGLAHPTLGQTKTYKVNGKNVKLEVDKDYIFAVPQEYVANAEHLASLREEVVRKSISAQMRVADTVLPPEEIRRIEKSALAVKKLNGYLVHRVPQVTNLQVHGLARLENLKSTRLV